MRAEELILYEDRDLIVCHKPAGIAVQSARLGQKDMVSILNNYLAERARMEQEQKPGKLRKQTSAQVSVVHRLDQPVEGVIVFAKTKAAASGLSKQITQGSMEKTYLAVCCVTEKGRKYSSDIVRTEYFLQDYLVKDGRTNTSRIAAKGQKDAKEARLGFQVLDVVEKCGSGENNDNGGETKRYLLAEIYLDTGRHHQIRVQMAHAGLPLYGDLKYNADCEKFRAGIGSEEQEKTGRMEPALCAVVLSFVHPVTKKEDAVSGKAGERNFCKFSVW